jgi:CRISPR-associated endonuclease Cas1
MSKSNSTHTKHEISQIEEVFQSRPTGPVCVVDGMGLSIRVERHHLIVGDGIGQHRRERRFHKATHGLSRIVILGSTGTISFDALRYCDRLGINVVVIDSNEVRPSFMALPSATNDARLRRVQALAPESGAGIEVTRRLLSAKLEGQAEVVRNHFESQSSVDTIISLREGLSEASDVEELRQLEASAAACYFRVWSGSSLVVPRFVPRDITGVPEHWLRYDGRRSVLQSNNGNRKAERPVNAILNYLFALVEVETVLACHVMGLDPSMGIMHLDQKNRSSMALDLMEPVRPKVEAWTLDLLRNRSFKRNEFLESSDGHVRLLAPLTHELAGSMGQWRKEVSPWVEQITHLLGDVVKGKFVPVTPLTGSNHKASQKVLKARKAKERVYRELASTRETVPRQKPSGNSPTLTRNCVECGGPLSRTRHVRCPQCWESQFDQGINLRKRRGQAIAVAKGKEREWKEGHPGEKRDPKEYLGYILPGLKEVPLSRIMAACGVAKSTASAIRSGKLVPAERHWTELQQLSTSSRIDEFQPFNETGDCGRQTSKRRSPN